MIVPLSSGRSIDSKRIFKHINQQWSWLKYGLQVNKEVEDISKRSVDSSMGKLASSKRELDFPEDWNDDANEWSSVDVHAGQ